MPADRGATPAGALPSRATGRQTPTKDGSSHARPVNPRHAPAASASGLGRQEAASSSRIGRPGHRTADPMPPPFVPPTAAVCALHGLSLSLSSSSHYYQQQQHPEQAYLAGALRRQGDRAMGLFQSLRLVEQRLAQQPPEGPAVVGGSGSGGRGSDRRRLRKEAALLRRKLAEAEQQERLILVRLGDIYVELQQQERRAQAEHQCRQRQRQQQQRQVRSQPVMAPPTLPVVYSQPFWGAGADYAASSDTPLWRGHGSTSLQAAPGRRTQAPLVLNVACSPDHSLLSPLSPVFEPRVRFSEVISWKHGGLGDFKSGEEEQAQDSIDPLCRAGVTGRDDQATPTRYICQGAVTTSDEKECGGEGGQGGRHDHKNGLSGLDTCTKRPSSPFLRIWSGRSCGGRSVSINTFSLYYCPKPRDKRMSLPSLKSLWLGEAWPL
ncbi:hypothetical protein RB595_005451 [Gaeumannomyces hyphopodioides]